MHKVFLVLVIFIFFTSCIPNKDLVYFQGDPSKNETVQQLQNKPYRLQVNDMLYIDIKSADPELVELFKNRNSGNNSQSNISQEFIYFTAYTIDRHGNIRIPYIGEINVLGYTTNEVREKLQSEFETYFKDKDDVFISVKLAGIRVTILGEVNNPGTVIVYQNQVNILEAIANAGDIAITGNRKKVTIIRKDIEGTKKYQIDLTDVSMFESEMFFVESNDLIYIEPLKQKSWGTGTSGMQTITSLIAVLSLVTTTILLINNIN